MGWTLGVAVGAVLVALIWRNRKAGSEDGGGAAATGPYRIHGAVELRNDCDGGGAALPDRILVMGVLTDGQRARVEARAEVDLTEGPGGVDDGPALVGRYDLRVEWSGRRRPAFWLPPHALRIDGSEICDGLGCLPNTHCVNLASRPRRIPADETVVDFTLRVACICVPQ